MFVRIQKFHQELLNKMLIFSQIFFIPVYQSEFPSIRKLANITPVSKKGARNLKENYRPVSILSNTSKTFEQCMFCQISSFMDSCLLKQQCGLQQTGKVDVWW